MFIPGLFDLFRYTLKRNKSLSHIGGKKSGLFYFHKRLNQQILQLLSSFKADFFPDQNFYPFFFYPTNIFTRLFWLKEKENLHLMTTRVLKYSEGNSDSNSTKYFCVLIKGSSI